ncbi:hypothetical protein AT959_04545 [Dechloromonas denitrificans]|uniref:STAS/SEC14 domain-containing protein n=1 Tax=Dechloromonas denitrificans TaxID=281362 RepID=A0A133XL31_9RHOO|nr:hypothetical protein [Dechloromonas denitrificans]KXB31638.1 hypothetical protein AT959_04545 [Dechloromonas denitrificans]
MAYEVDWEPEGLLKRFSGFVSGREFIQAVEQTQADPRFDEAHYVINDFSEASGHSLSEETLTQISAINYGAHASNPNCRIVYVTTDESLKERVRQVLIASNMSSYQTEVCPSLAEARDWLDSQPKLHLLSNVMGFRNI